MITEDQYIQYLRSMNRSRREEVVQLRAEIERLRAELALSQKTRQHHVERLNELRADAERWRFVREHSDLDTLALDMSMYERFQGIGSVTQDNLNDAIDWLIEQAKVKP